MILKRIIQWVLFVVISCSLVACDRDSQDNASHQKGQQQGHGQQASTDGSKDSSKDPSSQSSSQSSAKKAQRGEAVNVGLTTVCPTTVTLTATSSATLYADKQTDIVPKENGYITSMNAKEGDFIHKGDVMIQLDNNDEKNKLALAKIKVINTKRAYDRGLEIIKVDGISKQDLDDVHVAYLEAKNDQSQAQIALDDMSIVAPFDGYVGQINLSIGNYVTAGSTLTTLVNAKEIRAVYTLPSQYLSQVAVGQDVTISHFTGTDSLMGKVTFVSKVINSTTQTISLTAELDNSNALFSSGQDVAISQVIGSQANTLLAPRLSLTTDIGTYSLYTVKDNQAVQNTVTIGDEYGDQVEIRSGIKANDQIVTAGMDQLHQGSTVNVTSSGKACSL